MSQNGDKYFVTEILIMPYIFSTFVANLPSDDMCKDSLNILLLLDVIVKEFRKLANICLIYYIIVNLICTREHSKNIIPGRFLSV